LKEVYRILKKEGKFILYEGFRSPNFENRSDLQKKMAQLIEKSMAVPKGYEINKWLDLAKEIGFEVKENTDISEAIMPNLIRFHRLARKYFKYTFLSKIISAILPNNLIKNTIAGLLMPFSIKQKVQTYNRIILIKK
jgi:ubiquinone/menaquinone biosynthesis C-methylase UbiE